MNVSAPKYSAYILLTFCLLMTGFAQAQAAKVSDKNSKEQIRKISDPKPSDLKLTESKDQPQYKPGEIIVKFKESVGKDIRTAINMRVPIEKIPFSKYVKQLNRQFKVNDIQPVFKSIHKNRRGLERIFQLKFSSEVDISKVIEEYKKDENIEYAEANQKIEWAYTPNDYFFNSTDLWNLFNVNAPAAWDIATHRGDGVVVAVIDTGVDITHPDLAANIWSNPGEQHGDANSDGCPGTCGMDDDNDGLIDEDSMGCGSNGFDISGGPCTYLNDTANDDDENGFNDDFHGWNFPDNSNSIEDFQVHGTGVAGLVAAVGDNIDGVVGLSFNSKIMPVRIFSGFLGSSIDGARGIIYAADNGAKIINNSWGTYVYDLLIADAVNYAHDKGVLVVSSAGNARADYPGQQVCDEIWAQGTPANAENSMSVSAVNQDDSFTSYSNRAVKIDVAAPAGDNMLPRLLTTMPNNLPSTILDSAGNKYQLFSGTSGASPQVAALAALLMEMHPTWDIEEIKQAIRLTADDILAPGFEVESGYGRINALAAVSFGPNPPPISSIIEPRNCTLFNTGGTFDVVGSSGGPNFNHYTIEEGDGFEPALWNLLANGSGAVNDNVLTNINTANLLSGFHTIRLTTTDSNGVISEDRNVINVDNFEGTPLDMTVTINRLNYSAYEIVFTNLGPVHAHNISANMTIPSGLVFQGMNVQTFGNVNYNAGVFHLDHLYTGLSERVMFFLKEDGSVCSPVNMSVRILSANEADTNASNDEAIETVDPACVDIAVSKTVNTITLSQGFVTYMVNVTNLGPENIQGSYPFYVSDYLPSGLTYLFHTITGNGGGVSYYNGLEIGTLQAGGTVVLQLMANVDPNVCNPITNTAALQANSITDINPNNDSSSITFTPSCPATDMSINKSVLGIDKNGDITYDIKVTNNGPNAASSVIVEDPLSGYFLFQNATATQGTASYDPATHTVKYTASSLAPGATVHMYVTVVLNISFSNPTVIANTAAITSLMGAADSNPSNNSSSVNVTVQ